MIEKVYEIVKREGPVLPVEVATKLKVDSFVAHAFLMQLVEANRIKVGKEKIGSTFLYFMPGKEQAARAKSQSLMQQSSKTAKTFRKQTSVSSEVSGKREEFANRLKEIEEREEKLKKHVPVPLSEKEDFLERVKQAITPFFTAEPEIEIKQPEIVSQKVEAPKKEPVVEKPVPATPRKEKKAPKKKLFGAKVDITKLATEYLTERGAEIISTNVKKKKEIDFIVQVPSGIGPVKMFVKIKDKKSINEADLSLTYTQGQNKKLPVLFLTTGRLTKTAQNYLKVIGGLLKVKFLVPEDK